MPYIKQDQRDNLEVGDTPETPGELNYLITKLCDQYIGAYGKSYTVMNEIIGALESAKLEFYARVVRPYEDIKIKENGDVYTV